jgi:hypothetical protein
MKEALALIGPCFYAYEKVEHMRNPPAKRDCLAPILYLT